MRRRILAAVGALLVLLLAAVPAQAASPTVDPNEFDSLPWNVDDRVPFTGYGDVGGYYELYPDYDNHRLYLAVSVCDLQVADRTKKADISLDLRLSSPKFNDKKFTFVNGASAAKQSYSGFASGCRMEMEIDRLSHSVDGNAYLGIAMDTSLCGPLTVRLDYSCGGRSVCIFENAGFDYTLPEKTDAVGSGRAGRTKTTKHTTTKKKKVTTTKFNYTGTVPHTTKGARKSSAQTVTKFAYSGNTGSGVEEQGMQVENGTTAVRTDGAYTAAVTPIHRSTIANVLIYLAVALATAAVIAIVAGIVKAHRAKQEAEREKQRRLEQQEIEEYDE